MDKVKTLSGAMRLGASFTEQICSSLKEEVSGQIYTCALGAVMVATGTEPTNSTGLLVNRLEGRWPELGKLMQCPACADKRHKVRLSQVIVHLNDHHKWTREAIADWLEANGL